MYLLLLSQYYSNRVDIFVADSTYLKNYNVLCVNVIDGLMLYFIMIWVTRLFHSSDDIPLRIANSTAHAQY